MLQCLCNFVLNKNPISFNSVSFILHSTISYIQRSREYLQQNHSYQLHLYSILVNVWLIWIYLSKREHVLLERRVTELPYSYYTDPNYANYLSTEKFI